MSSTRLAAATAAVLLTVTGCELSDVRELVPGAGPDEPEATPTPTSVPEGGEPDEPVPGLTSDEPDEPEPGSTEAPDPEPGPEPTAEDYMAALAATDDPDRMREGLDTAAEGSAAHTYLLHQASIAQAWADEGLPEADTDIERVEGGYELCHGGDPDAEPGCSEFTGFTSEDDLITGFLVDGRDPGPHLVAGEGTRVGAGGVNARLLTAYRSGEDRALVATLEVTTADDLVLDLPGATYQEAGGRKRRADRAVGRREIDAGSGTHAALFFPDAAPGGSLTVSGCLEECSAFVKLALPVG